MIAGALIAVGAAIANAFAVVLQAFEARRAPLGEGGRITLLLRLANRPRWLAGVALMVVAWPLQVLALALAPITVVQPLLSTAQLVLLAVARVRLREHVGRLEALGALSIVAGIALVVWAAPRHELAHLGPVQLAPTLGVVGGLAAMAYVVGRLRPRLPIALVIGAGLAYAWVDFVNKLLANALSVGHVGFALLWLGATLVFGVLAFLEETTALGRRPAITVAPVIGAIHDPLPVLMALWSGVAVWGSAPHRVAPLIAGLAIIASGAAILGRSKAVARIADSAGMATEEAAGARAGSSLSPAWARVRSRRGEGVQVRSTRPGRPRAMPSLADDG